MIREDRSEGPDPVLATGSRLGAAELKTQRHDREDYAAFLARKHVEAPRSGIAAPPLAPHLFRFQRDCVAFGLEVGSWGLFLDTGLGKTACELEWSSHAAEASNGSALILAPLAVGHQIVAEGRRWGYDVRSIRSAADVGKGINVCNYDRLHLIDPSAFGAVALDESSILKNFTGITSRALIAAFASHRWRLSASATPAPNDHMELGQHCEFVGVMPSNEMLMRWFVADQTEMGNYRLKGHAVVPFWNWMASWSRMASHPRDLGDERSGFDLPPIIVHRHETDSRILTNPGELFASTKVSATDMHKVKRQTAAARAASAAGIGADGAGPCIVWCDTNYEADAVMVALSGRADVVEVRGSDSIDAKEAAIDSFSDGTARIIVTKPSICGHGLNWQRCSRMVFVGRTFSYESYYQAVRRCWRFGQVSAVNVHLIVAPGEDEIGRVIERKRAEHDSMKGQMVAAMRRAMGASAAVKVDYEPTHDGRLPEWL